MGKRGVRPFGCTAALQDLSRKTGKRLSKKDHRGVATTKRPLEGVMERLHRWFNNEREHRHEVRNKILKGCLKYELEFERDRQLVLEKQESKACKRYVLEACSSRLSTIQIINPT